MEPPRRSLLELDAPDVGLVSCERKVVAVIRRSQGTCAPGRFDGGGVDASQAYDYWRETAFYYFAADRQLAEAKAISLRAHVLVAPRGEFRLYRSDAISGSRTQRQVSADGGDNVDLGLVLAGVRVHHDGRVEMVARAGEFFVDDSAEPSHVRWTAD